MQGSRNPPVSQTGRQAETGAVLNLPQLCLPSAGQAAGLPGLGSSQTQPVRPAKQGSVPNTPGLVKQAKPVLPLSASVHDAPGVGGPWFPNCLAAILVRQVAGLLA